MLPERVAVRVIVLSGVVVRVRVMSVTELEFKEAVTGETRVLGAS